jgi:diguanylate cyclase (GGDEF)-like protein
VITSPEKQDFIPELWRNLSPYLGIAQAVIVFVYILSGAAHTAWLLVVSLFGIQILANAFLAARVRRIGHYTLLSYSLAGLNWLVCVIVVGLTGGFPSLFWLLFVLGAVQGGLFMGRLGAGLNAFFAGFALMLPVLIRGGISLEIVIDIVLLVVMLLSLGLITAKATALMLSERSKFMLAEEALRQTNVRLAIALAAQEEQSRESALLTEMADLLQACTVVEETFAIISHYVRRLFPLQNGTLFLFDPDRDVLEAATSWGEPDPAGSHMLFTPNQCWALQRGQIHWLDDPSSGLRCGHLSGSLAGQYVCVPLIAQGEIVGVLHMQNQRADPSHGPEPVRDLARSISTAKIAGEQIASAITNLRLRADLRNQSIRDPLTGLFNRRYLEETLEREIHRAIRDKFPISLIFIDIDHFKTFNDAYGHEMGDAVLKAFGAFLAAQVRFEDIPCRYGGEEFIIVLPDAPLEVARLRAEAIREGVKALEVETGEQVLGHITLSLGVSGVPECEARGETLLRAADAALYQAKNEGRDRVVVAKPAI